MSSTLNNSDTATALIHCGHFLMLLTSISGIMLDNFVSHYEGYAILAVAFGSIPGSARSIFISHQSTSLHATVSVIMLIRPGSPWAVKSLQLTPFCILGLSGPQEANMKP